MKFSIFLMFVTLVVFSCKSKQMTKEVDSFKEEVTVVEESTDVQSKNDLLYNRKWTHAREQSTDGNALYLNAEGRTFPPSRFRNSYEFNDDGTCRYMFLSPTDRHQMVDGKYTLEEDVLTIMSVDGQSFQKFTILKIDNDQLLLTARTIDK